MNKFYIQIVFFLLSIFIYMNNKTLATELTPGEYSNKIFDAVISPEELKKRNREYALSKEEHERINAEVESSLKSIISMNSNANIKINTISKKHCDTPEEIYEKNTDLLCTNPNEISNAVKLMNEAATHLEHHATTEEDYELWKHNRYYNNSSSIKKHGDGYVQRINCKYYHIYTYNQIINMLWDPALANVFNPHFVKRKFVRVYNPNLVIIRQRYKSRVGGPMKYFYALAAKVDISEDKTIIVMTSANINDHHPSEEEYKNKIIENANLFKIDIDSNNSIRNGKWEKTFVNIAGYIVKKKSGNVDITYLEYIDGHTSNYPELFIEKTLNKFYKYGDNALHVHV
ncbi:fam-a protein [Plasmodium vinckei brucechwatti]|uniref:Fam-a protein n=1 Tax=Plasmodium vinckei brucechwatti TaxID=119398 RepID=A0A6V7S6W2_PLAVN|nr:fam-a protein [Plasmodium vinckei brucechwatti]